MTNATGLPKKHWGWLLAAGMAYVPLGIISMVVPVASSFALTVVLSGVLLGAGVIHLIQAIKLRHESGRLIRFLQSILALVVGAIIFIYPSIGMMGIALTLSFYFLLGAAMQWLLATMMPPGGARGWVYASAVVSFIIGIYIVVTFPMSAFWVPGTLLGIELIFLGFGLIGFALSIREPNKTSRPSKPSKHLRGELQGRPT
jgi:uncharacterized membrane protein HdeD (DUF308 family)